MDTRGSRPPPVHLSTCPPVHLTDKRDQHKEMPEIDTWTDCRCTRQHATARGFLRCKVKRHTLIGGGGPYALIAWCTNVPTVTLWPTAVEAEKRHRRITNGWCGPGCLHAHQLVRIALH